MIEPIHQDCVACRAAFSTDTAEVATLVLLVMLHDDSTLEEIYQDLCFAHRRKVDDTVRVARSEREAAGDL